MNVYLTELETSFLPAREQREKEIRQLKGQHHRAITEDGTQTTEERHPIFLKQKAAAFYARHDYKSDMVAQCRQRMQRRATGVRSTLTNERWN